jgi:hypothetical protein
MMARDRQGLAPATLPSPGEAVGQGEREPRRAYLLLGDGYLIMDPFELEPALSILKKEIAGLGISIPRLPHGAYVHEVAKPPLQIEPGTSGDPAAPLLVLGEEEREVRMSDETDLANEVGERPLCIRQAEQVIPPLRVPGGRVDKKKSSVP